MDGYHQSVELTEHGGGLGWVEVLETFHGFKPEIWHGEQGKEWSDWNVGVDDISDNDE